MTTQPKDFSDFIVFADESGDHGLASINRQFPVFALAFCVVRVEDYINSVVPDMQRLKFSTWGHDSVILHEREIRRGEGDFTDLRADSSRRAAFMEGMNDLMRKVPIYFETSVIHKNPLLQKDLIHPNPYGIALRLCMESLIERLLAHGQSGKLVHVIFESRGKREDGELAEEFRNICSSHASSDNNVGDPVQVEFRSLFISKASNSVGLQLADLVARPIALKVLRPYQSNKAFDIIEPKIWDIMTFP